MRARAGFNNVDRDYFGRCSTRTTPSSAARGTSRAHDRLREPLHELDVQDLERARERPRAAGRAAQRREACPGARLGGPQAFKRVFLQALFEGDGSSSLLPRNTIQISYSTYSEQLAKDVQLLLLEFGVVSRLCRYAKGEIKVVITNRRDARLFALNVGFLGAKQEKLDASWRRSRARARALATTTSRSSRTTSARDSLALDR